MPGQAIVTIRDKQWVCSVANTYAELVTGLSGVPSIPAGTGMLFDLGYDQKYIEIDMSQMLFPLDIIFINSTQGVVGALQNVQPGLNATFHNEQLPGARCFLEVNAGEAEGIEFGDEVAVQGYTAPTTEIDYGVDITTPLVNMMLIMMVMVMMMKMVDRALAPPREKPKLPPGYEEIRWPQTKGNYDKELEQLRRDFREGAISEENYMRAVKEILARKHKPYREYVKIIAPGKTYLTIGGVVTREELERENKKARERGEQPATAEVWEGGKPVMIRPKVIPTEKTRTQPDKLEYLADSPEFLTQTIEAIGYRDKLDNAFNEAITRAKGLK